MKAERPFSLYITGGKLSQKKGATLWALLRSKGPVGWTIPYPADCIMSSKTRVKSAPDQSHVVPGVPVMQVGISASTLFYTVAFVEGAAVMVREKLLGMPGAVKAGRRIDLKITNTTTTTC